MLYYLAVVGSRSFTDKGYMLEVILRYQEKYGLDLVIISGECPSGGDRLAKENALDNGIEYQAYPPRHGKWNQYCEAHPPEYYNQPYNVKYFWERNTEIAEKCNECIGFVVKGIRANGTMDTINKATKLNKPSMV